MVTDSPEKIQKYDQNNPIRINGGIVLVGGCFDILHYGHLQFLKAAKKKGEKLVVALESDEYIKNRKKRTPIHTQQQRAEVLAELHAVDLVILLPFMQSDEEYFRLVRNIKPSVIAVTEGDRQLENKKKQAEEVGGRVEIATKQIQGFSTTNIITNSKS